MRYEQVYNRIKELCEERGWSQYRLIKESGIPQSSFYNMMDRESIPQLDMIQRICDGLNITLNAHWGLTPMCGETGRVRETGGYGEAGRGRKARGIRETGTTGNR